MSGNDGNEFGPQAGIVSHGVSSCDGTSSIPGVYSSTADPVNRDWILHQLNVWVGTTSSTNRSFIVSRNHSTTTMLGSDITVTQAAFSFIPLVVSIVNLLIFAAAARRWK